MKIEAIRRNADAGRKLPEYEKRASKPLYVRNKRWRIPLPGCFVRHRAATRKKEISLLASSLRQRKNSPSDHNGAATGGQ